MFDIYILPSSYFITISGSYGKQGMLEVGITYTLSNSYSTQSMFYSICNCYFNSTLISWITKPKPFIKYLMCFKFKIFTCELNMINCKRFFNILNNCLHCDSELRRWIDTFKDQILSGYIIKQCACYFQNINLLMTQAFKIGMNVLIYIFVLVFMTKINVIPFRTMSLIADLIAIIYVGKSFTVEMKSKSDIKV